MTSPFHPCTPLFSPSCFSQRPEQGLPGPAAWRSSSPGARSCSPSTTSAARGCARLPHGRKRNGVNPLCPCAAHSLSRQRGYKYPCSSTNASLLLVRQGTRCPALLCCRNKCSSSSKTWRPWHFCGSRAALLHSQSPWQEELCWSHLWAEPGFTFFSLVCSAAPRN